jgi:catechol 2,3-dioxygenase-like lactoylglutathione lyase family enzyme
MNQKSSRNLARGALILTAICLAAMASVPLMPRTHAETTSDILQAPTTTGGTAGQTPGRDASAQSTPEVSKIAASAHFHHLHLNTTDPDAAIKFYTSKFDCERGKFAGLLDGVWAQNSWLLFNKVSKPPAWEPVSAIWHFGWGAEDMQATYQKQLDSGTQFFTPITQLGPNFYYAYVQSPDRALIELNTADHHHFGHLHLFSADPIKAAEFYIKYFGAKPRSTWPPSPEPRFRKDVQIGPSASLMLDNVNIIIYPVQYSLKQYATYWKPGETSLAPTKDRVVDHVGISFDNLEQAVEQMRGDGVKVTQEIKSVAGGKIKYAFIDGPDNIRIEMIEGRAHKE